MNESDSAFGTTHLSDNSITMTYGLVLIVALVALIFLRLVFADVSVSARGGA